MARVYNTSKRDYEDKGFMPFVAMVRWKPEEEPAAIERYSKIFATPEGKGVKGVHTWNLIGKNTMIVIGWTNSPVSLQKFCTSITYGTGLSLDVSYAIEHDSLMQAFNELKARSNAAADSGAKPTPK